MLQLFSLPTVNVASGGVAYPLTATQVFAASISLQADFNNVGRISVGGEDVTTTTGIQLAPGDSCVIEYPSSAKFTDEFDLSKIYITSASANDKVRVIYMKRR